MLRFAHFLTLIAVLGLLVVGCSEQQNPLQSQSGTTADRGETISLATGIGDVTVATLNVYVSQASGEPINLHVITSDWIESGPGGVTWSNFGGAYEAAVCGTFNADAIGWHSVDITTAVEGWMNGTKQNFGFLLRQPDGSFPSTVFHAREMNANTAYVELCLEGAGGPECQTIEINADAFIAEYEPDRSNGDAALLITGRPDSYAMEKQSLVRFELPPVVRLAELGDYVWIDHDRDGIQDADELGMPDVVVNLYDCFGQPLATTMTDGSGFYLFTGLIPGDYYVEFVKPQGYSFSPQDQGMDDAMDSDADMATGMTICTTLEPGESDLTWDAGLYLDLQDGCSLTIGFWKNHCGFGPQADVLTPLLPIWLGDEGGDHSMYVATAAMARDILVQKTYGKPSNGITKLYAQMLAAKLNVVNGASDRDIVDELGDADGFLADNSWEDWDRLSKKTKKDVNKLKSTFDEYNNGDIGPGHCD